MNNSLTFPPCVYEMTSSIIELGCPLLQIVMPVKNQNRMANRLDPDETAHNESSHQDLQCLHWYLVWSIRLKGLTDFHTERDKSRRT